MLQPAEARNAFQLLEKALAGRLSSLQAELSLMMSLKDLLEGELSTANLQKDILQRDLMTVQEQHEGIICTYVCHFLLLDYAACYNMLPQRVT